MTTRRQEVSSLQYSVCVSVWVCECVCTHVQPTMGLHQLISFSPLFLLIVCPLGMSLSLSSSLYRLYQQIILQGNLFFFFLNSFVSSPSPPTPFPHSLSLSLSCSLFGSFLFFTPPLSFFFSHSLLIHFSLYKPIPLEVCWLWMLKLSASDQEIIRRIHD